MTGRGIARGYGVELDLNREGEHHLRDDLGARALDVFGTANFLYFIPWTAALEYLLAQGIEAIAGHDQALVEQLIGRLEDTGYRFISPTDAGQRAAIVAVSAADPADNEAAYQRLTDAGVDAALRAGNIRLSPLSYSRNGMSIFVLLLYSGYALGKVAVRFRSSMIPQ